MKFLISLISLMFFVVGCSDPKQKTVLKDSEPAQLIENDVMYEFLNSCVFNDSVNRFSGKAFSGNFFLPNFMSAADSLEILNRSNIFSKADADYIFSQDQFSRYFKIDKTLVKADKDIIYIPENLVFNSTEHRAYIDKMVDIHNELTIMKMPLFSKDRKTVLISIGTYCGLLCGEGATFIFRKTDKGWVILETYGNWIS